MGTLFLVKRCDSTHRNPFPMLFPIPMLGDFTEKGLVNRESGDRVVPQIGEVIDIAFLPCLGAEGPPPPMFASIAPGTMSSVYQGPQPDGTAGALKNYSISVLYSSTGRIPGMDGYGGFRSFFARPGIPWNWLRKSVVTLDPELNTKGNSRARCGWLTGLSAGSV